MPNRDGKFVGTGWSRSSAAAWERVFGPPSLADDLERIHRAVQKRAADRKRVPDLMAALEASLSAVPTRPSREVEHLADRTAAMQDGWGEDDYDQRRSAHAAWD